jgi:hypothetical protein
MRPFVTGVNLQLPHTWHGLNSVEIARGMQDFKNIIWANFLTYVKLHAQPVVKVEENSVQGAPNNEGVSKQLEARAGAVWKLTQGSSAKVTRESPPQMGNSIFEILNKAEESLRDSLGMQNIAMGKKAPGEQTATEALELQTNSKVRSALENHHTDIFTLDLMKKVHMFLKYYWQPGDMARIIGQASPITIDTQMLDARFDLKMEVGTVLPFDEERNRIKADRVLQVVGPTYLLDWMKAYDVANPEDRAAEAVDFMAQQAEAAQAQQEGEMKQEMEMKQMESDTKIEEAKVKAKAKPQPKSGGKK